MKKFVLTIISLVLLAGFSAHAETSQGNLPETLSATMKLMGQTLRTMGQQANDPSQNAASELLASEVSALARHAKIFVPKSIAALPEEQQPEALARYQDLLEQVAQVSEQVAQAFRENRNSELRALFAELNRLRKEGHALFDPDDF